MEKQGKQSPATLLVTRHEAMRKTLSDVLADEGYDVRDVSDIDEAIDTVPSWPARFVLFDHDTQDCREFLRRYREAGGAGLVIVMTSYGSHDLALAIMAAGAYDYLPKPFTAAEVLLTLGKAECREALRSAEGQDA